MYTKNKPKLYVYVAGHCQRKSQPSLQNNSVHNHGILEKSRSTGNAQTQLVVSDSHKILQKCSRNSQLHPDQTRFDRSYWIMVGLHLAELRYSIGWRLVTLSPKSSVIVKQSVSMDCQLGLHVTRINQHLSYCRPEGNLSVIQAVTP